MTISRAGGPVAATAARNHPGGQRPGRQPAELLDDLPDVVARIGADGVIRYVSPSAVAVLGMEPECLVGRHVHDFVHPDDVLPFARVVGRAGDTVAPTSTVHRLRRGDGSYGWYETTVRARHDPLTGAVYDVVSVTRSASVRVVTERSLADGALRCRTALDAVDCGVVVLGRAADVVMANAAAERLLGARRADLVGRRLADTVPFGDETGRRLTAHELACAEAVRTGQPCIRTVTVTRADGTVALLHTRAQPVRDSATGQVREVVLTVGPSVPSVGGGAGAGLPRPRVPAAAVGLTPREMQVLTLLAAGLDTTAAAAELGLSVHTVRGHVKSLLAKLDAHSQVQAVVTALRRGLLEVD